MLLLTRNRMLMGALTLVLAIDGVLNSAMTVSEHLLALLAGALTCRLLSGGGNNPTSKVVTLGCPNGQAVTMDGGAHWPWSG